MDFQRGTLIAQRYRLDHLVGEGGMGVVWAAKHTVTDKVVALKFLSSTSATPELQQRFLREARAACAVDHPNIVRIHDVLEHDGMPFMVMDLLGGESLGVMLERKPKLSIEETASILLPVVSAVGAAHTRGIVHRDLKPDNIFLSPNTDDTLHVTVLDFGIAKVTAPEDSPATALTNTGALLGTPHYMAPEQVFGEKDVDQRADIWSLGIILYECLSGQRPTAADNVGQIFKMVTTGKIPPLEVVAPEVPADVAEMVRDMLQRDREARIGNLRHVSTILARYTNVAVRSFGAPLSGPTMKHDALAATLDAVAVKTSSQTKAQTTPDATPAHSGRRRVAFGLAILATISSIGVAAIYLANARTSPTPATSIASFVQRDSVPASTPQAESASVASVLPATPPPVESVSTKPVTSFHARVPSKPVASEKPASILSVTNCDPPYIIDAQGHRIPKQGCY